jgi:hypothetical protein
LAFVDPYQPIAQGQRAAGKNDMAFREALGVFRTEWEAFNGKLSNPADGFFIINELRLPRRRATYSVQLLDAYRRAIASICKTLEMPIRYAGPGEWTVFKQPTAYDQLSGRSIGVPGTQPQDKCLVLSADLWQTFQAMSLWVEALCIHEWCLFTERIEQEQPASRGDIYTLLTARPDNRRPLTWESNQIDLLLLEGEEFICPWTDKRIVSGTDYDIDHLLPVSVYPINELWNLLPADPDYNRHTKRDRLPSSAVLQRAKPNLKWGYERYSSSQTLDRALREDVMLRFAALDGDGWGYHSHVADAVVNLIEQVAESRNLQRFGAA